MDIEPKYLDICESHRGVGAESGKTKSLKLKVLRLGLRTGIRGGEPPSTNDQKK